MRTLLWLLTVAACCELPDAARAQDIVRPREFTLLRPQEPPPAPMIMAPINVQPLAQTQWNWTNNNPHPITIQPLRPQTLVPQGNRWHSDQFQTWNFQSHNWNANDRWPLGGNAGHDQLHRQALGW
ncbi:MAG TPA: hypothetical protein VIK18_19135 [Pirellulales bacterium]